MGRRRPLGDVRPLSRITRRGGEAADGNEGCVSPDGRVLGTYLHGFLDNDAARAGLYRWLGQKTVRPIDYQAFKERQYDRLADHLERHLRVEPLFPRIPK
jgi:adenosylcobyric acid synthase